MEHVDVDALVEGLRDRVAQRRAQGDYPPGLEEQLEAEFKIIMGSVHRDEVGTSELRRQVQVVSSTAAAVRSDPSFASHVPGGAAIHGLAGKLVQRHTGLLADSVRSLGGDIATALDEIRRLFDVQRGADERQLNDVVASMVDRLAVIDHLADAVLDLERRMAALESTA